MSMSIPYDPEAMRERLANALKEKGISMRKASLDSGLSDTFLHGVLKLKRDPSVLNLAKVCDTLGLSLSYVMSGNDLSPEAEEVVRLLQDNPSKRTAILELLRG